MLRNTFIAALLAAGSAAQATETFNVHTTTCSGALASSFSDGVSLACTGDLALSTGSIESGTQIVLTATGSLSLFDISLKAPNIYLTANTVGIDSESDISTGGAAGGDPATWPTNPGAVISIGGHVLPPRTAGELLSGGGQVSVVSGGDIVLTPGPILLSVPEPGTALLTLAGLGVMVLASRARKRCHAGQPVA